MDVTLLYFGDCPNWLVADGHLRSLAAEQADLRIVRRLVDTPEAAEETQFRGSPSILVDGVGALADPDAPVGLSCRDYQAPDGPAGSPTIEQRRAALRAHHDNSV